MALPETIIVRFTEEDAEYLSVRPVQRQTFQLHELVDMVLAVTGKDPARVQHILRTGSLVYHFFRYRWEGFELAAEELSAVLARFPDADPSRAFDAAHCISVLLARPNTPAAPGQALLPALASEILRDQALRRKLFSAASFWDALMETARAAPPQYLGYSYARRGDVYSSELSPEEWQSLLARAKKTASRELRAQLAKAGNSARLFFICTRTPA